MQMKKKRDNHFGFIISLAVNAVIENENVNCEISQKDDQTAGI